jgi:glycosyltransferase involved in cell wall biosynthesis
MSLLPLEMMAAGCIPVLNEAEHTRMVPFSSQMEYAEPSPAALAEALHNVVADDNIQKRAQKVSQYAQKFHWDESNAIFEKVLLQELAP